MEKSIGNNDPDTFETKLGRLAEENWKVKNLLRDLDGYDNFPPHIKTMVDSLVEKHDQQWKLSQT